MKYKVIFHVDELDKWSLALRNAMNLIKYCEETGEEYDVEVLANAAAVKELAQTSPHGDSIKALSEKNVAFVACQNALKGNDMDEKELFPFVSTVPAGVVELIVKQNEGYAYIRP